MSHPVCPSLYLSLPLSRSDPKTPHCSLSLSDFSPVTLLISFLSHILFCPLTVPHSAVSPLSQSPPSRFHPHYIIWSPFPSFPRGLLPPIPSLSSLCFHSLHLLFSFTNARLHSFFSRSLSLTRAFSFSLSVTRLLLLFYNPSHPSRSLTLSPLPILPPSLPL